MMIVENEDGGDHAGGDHEHDAVEVGTWGGENKLITLGNRIKKIARRTIVAKGYNFLACYCKSKILSVR